MFVSHHIGAGKWTHHLLCKSNKCSHLPSHCSAPHLLFSQEAWAMSYSQTVEIGFWFSSIGETEPWVLNLLGKLFPGEIQAQSTAYSSFKMPMCVCFSLCACYMYAGVHGGQGRTLDPLEPELKVVISNQTQVPWRRGLCHEYSIKLAESSTQQANANNREVSAMTSAAHWLLSYSKMGLAHELRGWGGGVVVSYAKWLTVLLGP